MNSNMLLGIFIAVILGAIILYLNQNDQQPIPNDGSINLTDIQYGNRPTTDRQSMNSDKLTPDRQSMNSNRQSMNSPQQSVSQQVDRPIRPPILDNRRANNISGDLVSDIVSQYAFNDDSMNELDTTFTASDPMSETHGTFTNYGHKRQLNMKKMEQPYSDDQDYSYKPHRVRNKKGKVDLNLNSDSEPDYFAERSDSRDFTHKKRQFTKRTPDDIADQFDIASMLPQEDEKDWFDTMHSLTAKKVQGTHLLHPKVHMGVNTVNSSLRNATHDIRGDIPNPKFFVGLWNNSTMEPDTNIKGICSSI